MKSKANFALDQINHTQSVSEALLQAEGAGIGTEFGNQLLEKAIALARIRVPNPLKEAKEILTDALGHVGRIGHHTAECAAQAFANNNRCCPPNHPGQPACTCWVGRAADWLKNNPEI